MPPSTAPNQKQTEIYPILFTDGRVHKRCCRRSATPWLVSHYYSSQTRSRRHQFHVLPARIPAAPRVPIQHEVKHVTMPGRSVLVSKLPLLPISRKAAPSTRRKFSPFKLTRQRVRQRSPPCTDSMVCRCGMRPRGRARR
jgi:hypothetical protein